MKNDAVSSLMLLGSPHLRRDGARFDLPDALPGYLVVYLATRGDWVLREEMAVLLWPEATESEAQNNLRVNLTRLRPHLARWSIEPLFVAERRRLRLDIDSDVRALRAAHTRGAWIAAADAARGQFLDGMSFRAFPVLGEWARSEREALRALWRDAVLRTSDAIAPQARLDLASRYLAADPLDEDIVRVQLGALAALGRSDEAQRVFARFSEQVSTELGVDVTVALADYAGRLGRPASGEAQPPARFGADEPLIGREAELAAIAQLVIDTPLVTVVGLGGIGKTRLARALQVQLAPQFGDGVLWLSLIDLSGVAEIVRRLGDLLQVTLAGGRDPVEQVAEHIGDRKLLLVLDNAEHLLNERAALHALLTRLFEGCPQLHCLVASREALHHPRERSVRLEGLEVPSEADVGVAVLGTAAVRLFVQQAQRVRPAFDPRSTVADLARIAHLTGGMPLALRIAAAWAGFLSCADIAAELRRGLDALDTSTGEPTGVRATLARTWDRLSAAERAALAALSVFQCPFSVQAARDVAQAALPVLGSLSDSCLLLPSEGDDGAERARFELHPLVRAFAAERLATDAAAQRRAHDRHATYVLRVLAPWFDFRRVDQRKALIAIGNVMPEARVAWTWALGTGSADFIVRSAAVLGNYLQQKGHLDEGISLLAEVERQFDPQPRSERAALAAAAGALASLLFLSGDQAAAEDQARRALAWSRSLEHRAGIRHCLNTLGRSLLRQGRAGEARAALQEALDFARDDDDRLGEATVTHDMALLELTSGESQSAEVLWRRALPTFREMGDQESATKVLSNLGFLLVQSRRLDEAQPLLDEGLRLSDEHGFTWMRATLLSGLGALHREAGRLQAAMTFGEMALVAARQAGERRMQTASMLLLSGIAQERRETGAAAAWLRDALRLARTTSDISNQLSGLIDYGEWCERQGRHQAAAVAWLSVLAHPRLSGTIKLYVDRNWQAAAFDPGLVEAAEREARSTDALALVEQALVELDRSAAPPPQPARAESISQGSTTDSP